MQDANVVTFGVTIADGMTTGEVSGIADRSDLRLAVIASRSVCSMRACLPYAGVLLVPEHTLSVTVKRTADACLALLCLPAPRLRSLTPRVRVSHH